MAYYEGCFEAVETNTCKTARNEAKAVIKGGKNHVWGTTREPG